MSIGSPLGGRASPLPDPAKDPLRFMQASAAALAAAAQTRVAAASSNPWELDGDEGPRDDVLNYHYNPNPVLNTNFSINYGRWIATGGHSQLGHGRLINATLRPPPEQSVHVEKSSRPYSSFPAEEESAGWESHLPSRSSSEQTSTPLSESANESLSLREKSTSETVQSTFRSGLSYQRPLSRRSEIFASTGQIFAADSRQTSSRTTSFGAGSESRSASQQLFDPSREAEFILSDPVVIKQAPQKGGFIIKHVNYTVEYQNIMVIRRYSDFLWLHESLLKRFPFRFLPPIPPKKVQADAHFLSQRLRALRRFMFLIQKHPIMIADRLVVTFLTIGTDFGVFRKSIDPSWLEEEFSDSGVSAEMMQKIPEHFNAILETVKLTLPGLLDAYRSLSILFEGVAKRALEDAMDNTRIALLLDNLKTHVCYKPACPECLATSQVDSLMSSSFKESKIIKEAKGIDQAGITLESIKKHRDFLFGLHDLITRCESALSQIDLNAIRSRIDFNSAKLNNLKSSSSPDSMSKEVEKLEALIAADKDVLAYQQARTHVIRFCLLEEIEFYHSFKQTIQILYRTFSDSSLNFCCQESQLWSATCASF